MSVETTTYPLLDIDDTQLDPDVPIFTDEAYAETTFTPNTEFRSATQCRIDLQDQQQIQQRRLDDYQLTLLDEDTNDLHDPLPITPSGILLKEYILMEGFGDHHIAVFDNWIKGSAYNNVYGRQLTMPDGNIVSFENLRIFNPRYTRGMEVYPLTPKLAMEQGVTYGCDWHVDVVLRTKFGEELSRFPPIPDGYISPFNDIQREELERRPGVCIGNVPVMLKSQHCILHGKTPRELALLGQDPKDPGGYFIVDGVEKIILGQEQLAVDKILLMSMNNKGSAVVRMTANTVRGTALIELVLDKKTNSIIKMRFPSMRTKKGEKYKNLNVLRIFRILATLESNRLAREGREDESNELTDMAHTDNIKDTIARFIRPSTPMIPKTATTPEIPASPNYEKKSLLKLTRTLVNFMILPDDIGDVLTKKMEKPVVTDKEILDIFDKDLFPHLNNLQGPDNEHPEDRYVRITLAKLNLLAIMTARFLEYLAGFRALDDRDSWSNKRVEGAGRMMEQLFRNAWRKTLGLVQASIETNKGAKDLGSVVVKLQSGVITTTFRDSFITNNWGVKGQQMKNNVAQTLVRDSVVATFAHINTVDVGISRTDRQQALRLVQNTQWGFISAVSTPEGENCGLIKNLCLTAKVSIGRNDSDIIRYLIGDEILDLRKRVTWDYNDAKVRNGKWIDKIIVSGKFIGWCNGEKTRQFLVNLRRSGDLCYDMSVIKENEWLYIDISPSRLVRPLLIVNPESQVSTNTTAKYLMLDEKGLRGVATNKLVVEGVMEYISSWEQEYIKIAVTETDIADRLNLFELANNTLTGALAVQERVALGEQVVVEGLEIDADKAKARVESAQEEVDKLARNRPFTHCELDPLAILGIADALIPWPDHNQAPRNTYQVSMGKQALGIYHSNHLNRMNDSKTKVLAFPNRPMLETDMYNVIGLDERGPGENVNIAFIAYPYTEEDAFIVKKEFLDNGGMRIYKYITYKTSINEGNSEVKETLERPDVPDGPHVGRYKYIQMGAKGDPMNGLPKIGAPLRSGDCIIGKVQRKSGEPDRNESIILRVGDDGVVEKVLVTTDNKKVTVIVKLRVMRIPEEGDKFAPRNAQKGTVGLVMSDIDMPFSKSGMTPDFIINPHCFVGDTPILLKNGMARQLTTMKYDGGDKIWSWDIQSFCFVDADTMGYEAKGVRDVMQLTLSDGRTIKCTPEHKIPVLERVGNLDIRRVVEFQDINENMYFMAGIDGVIDIPSDDEDGWELKIKNYVFTMIDQDERDKSLAFSRLVGLICADGCVTTSKDNLVGNIVIGTVLDVETVLDDLQLITNKRPAATKTKSKKGGSTFTIMLPKAFCQALASLNGMVVGKRTTTTQSLPYYLFDEKCPLSIIREFLGGYYGGDGWSPYLTTNNQDGQGTVTFNPPAISQSAKVELLESLEQKMLSVNFLLERLGVFGSRLEKPKPYNLNTGKGDMVSSILQCPKGTEFGDKVGFRYCVQKMYRMAAYQSYQKYLQNVKRQNDIITKRSSEIFDSKAVGNSLAKALSAARAELFVNELPFNTYYSNATLDQVKNRRRKDRYDELMKWDYNFIEDADAYLRKIRAYHWFRTAEGTGGADYIIKQHDKGMPFYLLRFHDKRLVEPEHVYDIGVWKTHTLSTSGIAVSQCLPSRMTLSYPMELMASKHGAMRGAHINGGAFQPFEMNKYRESLKQYGQNEFAYEEMRSGTSGKPLLAPIYSGPIFFQALRHHVRDKVQARGTGQVKPLTRQPTRGRGNRGGLRFGEMERDAAISHGASSFLRERLMLVSDKYQTVFCKNCGTFAVNDPTTYSYKPCKLCNSDKNFGRCVIPYAYKLLIHLLAAPGINLRPEFVTSEEYATRILNQRDTTLGLNLEDPEDPDEGLEEEVAEEDQEQGFEIEDDFGEGDDFGGED